HIGRNTVDTGVKPLRNLPADKARHRHAPRHAHLCPSWAGDLPFLAVKVRGGTIHVGNKRARGFFIRNSKGHIAFEVDGDQLRSQVIHHRNLRAVVIVVLAHADVGYDFYVEAVVDIFLDDFLAHGIKPRTRGNIPGNQASSPRQFDNTSGGEVTGHLDLETGPRRSHRANFAGTDDNHHVIEFLVHTRKIRRGPLNALADIWQCPQTRHFFYVLGNRLDRYRTRQFRQVDISLA